MTTTSRRNRRMVLKATRQAAGLTARELAKMVGVSRNYIFDLESGNHAPGLAVATRIAAKLGQPVSRLFPGDVTGNTQNAPEASESNPVAATGHKQREG